MENIDSTMDEGIQEKAFPKYMYIFGLICIALSGIIYIGFETFLKKSSSGPSFFIHYILFIILLVGSLISKASTLFGFTKSAKNVLVFPIIVAGTISCFALNKEVTVFYSSTNLLTIILVIVNATVLCIPFLNYLPKIIQKFAFVILGVAWLLYLYFTIILITIYPMGMFGIIFLGLGIHVFLPLICLTALTSFFISEYKKHNKKLFYSLSAILLIIIGIVVFTIKWNARATLINNIKQEMNLNAPNDLQDWITIAQKIPATSFSKRVLMSDVMYTSGDIFFERGWDLYSLNNDEERLHDPFITIASIFSPRIDLSDDEIIKIMEATFDIRHLTESRLWSGKDLVSKTVTSNVRIYPNERLAYTEKIITVENQSTNSWINQQEAIYSFYLPEGATVSSLSLWINGVEEKGYLTTKGKAQKAYTTIVGVEQRDPSVVHWQEGNRVSLRVFPCLSYEPRQFKIGITSPLKLIGDRLQYDNIYFKGPDASDAKEIIQVNYTEKVADLDQPNNFDKTATINTYKSKQRYKPNWKISFKSKPIRENQFVYKGKKYSISESYKINVKKEYTSYYLDINKNWSSKEWTEINKQLKGKKIMVYTDRLILLNEKNKTDIFKALRQNNFSLFPFYKIPESEQALVITKSNEICPNLKDLNNTTFYTKLIEKIKSKKNRDVIDLGENTSPYLKTLAEFRAIDLQHKSLSDFLNTIKSNSWTKNLETANSVYIPSANIIIKEEATSDSTSNASNHNFRLYGYNTVLKQLNMNYYINDSITEESIELAASANVVTPLSSLIVLEKKEDYERFDIKKTDGVGNASMHSDGAVPEPHEWALIIALSIFILYAIKNKRYATA